MMKSGRSKVLIEIFDTLFILILCFLTLFTALIISKNNISDLNYKVNYKTLAATISGLVVYLAFVHANSEKGLKEVLSEIYEVNDSKEKGCLRHNDIEYWRLYEFLEYYESGSMGIMYSFSGTYISGFYKSRN